MIPAALILGRFYPASHQLHTVLMVDAARWQDWTVTGQCIGHHGPTRYSPLAFAKAAQLALNFKLYTLQLGAANHRATA